MIAQRHIAVFETLPALFEQVRCLAHRLLATGDDDLVLARPDQLVGEGDRVDARQAHLVQGQRGHVHRNTAGHCRLPSRDLARARGEHLPHDHVIDLLGRDATLLQRRLDREAAEVGPAEVLQPSEQPADRGTRTGDDHGSGHDEPSFPHSSIRWIANGRARARRRILYSTVACPSESTPARYAVPSPALVRARDYRWTSSDCAPPSGGLACARPSAGLRMDPIRLRLSKQCLRPSTELSMVSIRPGRADATFEW